ncbi:hypothetical protein DW936_16025 [Odoribacter splanchnicus]|nr:hypothetical protein DW936_16025 [Odoribacter splanchnicus]
MPKSGRTGRLCQSGCPATNLIVTAYMKGLLKKTEARHAFTVMKHNHMPGGMLGTDDMFIILKYSTDRFYKLNIKQLSEQTITTEITKPNLLTFHANT